MCAKKSAKYFTYGEESLEFLRAKDKKLARAIDAVGTVRREMDPDLFTGTINSIVGQQISTAAHRTVFSRMKEKLGEITPAAILSISDDDLQSCGLTFRKVEYIKDFARKVDSGEFNLDAVREMTDDEAIAALSSLKGIGRWTAEMLLIFCLNRMDIFSFDDIGIKRGMRMVYHHKEISRELFERYRRRFSPYGSVASLYFWAISHMDVPGYESDYK